MMEQQQQQNSKVERFLKLGYSQSDILRVLDNLRHDAQTNDILEELIKTCQARANKATSRSPKLVPRGCSPAPARPKSKLDKDVDSGFRPVVIDGSNVAMSHGDKKVFSCRGLQLAVDWFWDRGLRDIIVFVPLWRKQQPRPEAPLTDQHVLHELESRKILVYTPSRCVNGKMVVCYDDRYIVKLAFSMDGIIVSNDNYRDLQMENPQWKKFIEERLLMYTFVNNKFMPPDDPLGRNGPTIDEFLRKKPWSPDNKLQHCPYGKKCTYGVKCKFYHPERTSQSQMSVADELRAKTFSPTAFQSEHRPSTTDWPSSTDGSLPTWSGLHFSSSSDTDEAFGSLESSWSRLSLQDRGVELRSSSSGLGSISFSSSSWGPLANGGSSPSSEGALCHCGQQQGGMSAVRRHEPVWGSCPALHPPHSEQFSDSHHLRPSSHKQTWSLPREMWRQVDQPKVSGIVQNCAGGPRTDLQRQLSTLFPQNLVEVVMSAHPRLTDLSELIRLIQSYRASHINY